VIAYKFLAAGAKGPLSGYAWPRPGTWLEVDGPLVLCRRGVHLCRSLDLAHWLHDELWEAETQGDQIEGIDCIVVPRARLVRRIDSWSEGGAARFAQACIEHATSLLPPAAGQNVREFLDDAKLAADAGYFAVSAFSSALAAAKTSPSEDEEKAYRHERVWQAEWITREVIGP
jgi:hypothetical protein